MTHERLTQVREQVQRLRDKLPTHGTSFSQIAWLEGQQEAYDVILAALPPLPETATKDTQ
jgi:hypothetical protein